MNIKTLYYSDPDSDNNSLCLFVFLPSMLVSFRTASRVPVLRFPQYIVLYNVESPHTASVDRYLFATCLTASCHAVCSPTPPLPPMYQNSEDRRTEVQKSSSHIQSFGGKQFARGGGGCEGTPVPSLGWRITTANVILEQQV